MKKNMVVHFEIYADDPDALQKFYAGLFDWTFQPLPEMDYRMIHTVETDKEGMAKQAGGINGGMMKRPPDYEPAAWVNYVNVDSIEATVERAKKLGATVARDKSPVPGMGWFAIINDPQENCFGIWQTDPKAR